MIEKNEINFLKSKIKDIFGLDCTFDDSLLDNVKMVNLGHGQSLFNQNELAHSCFLVLSGNLKIVLQKNGVESLLTILSKGEFGGVLLMGYPAKPYLGSVIALTHACVLVIPKESYNTHWIKHEKIFNLINNSIQSRIRFLQEDKILQINDVETRVKAFLFRHYIEKQDLISKKITRKDIALAIGAKTETVIRMLKKFERMGVVKTNKSIISILDKTFFIKGVKHES